MNFAIRCDGGSLIGMGHVMRCLVLAKELSKSSKVLFICKEGDGYSFQPGIDKIKDEGFKVVIVNEKKLLEGMKIIKKNNHINCLITDSYDVDEDYFNKISDIFEYTVYIDDINICKLNVDCIINQNINAKDLNYNINPNRGTKLLLGTEYCMLREEFRNKYHKKINKKVKNMFITVGGTDKDHISLKLLNVVKEFNIPIHLAIGNAFEEKLVEELECIREKYEHINLYKNANMSELMKKCDIAISTTGSTIYELAAMNLPTIGIVVAENQREVCREMDRRGIIIGTEDLIYTDHKKFKEIVLSLINDEDLRINMMKNQRNIISTNGVENIVKNIYLGRCYKPCAEE